MSPSSIPVKAHSSIPYSDEKTHLEEKNTGKIIQFPKPPRLPEIQQDFEKKLIEALLKDPEEDMEPDEEKILRALLADPDEYDL